MKFKIYVKTKSAISRAVAKTFKKRQDKNTPDPKASQAPTTELVPGSHGHYAATVPRARSPHVHARVEAANHFNAPMDHTNRVLYDGRRWPTAAPAHWNDYSHTARRIVPSDAKGNAKDDATIGLLVVASGSMDGTIAQDKARGIFPGYTTTSRVPVAGATFVGDVTGSTHSEDTHLVTPADSANADRQLVVLKYDSEAEFDFEDNMSLGIVAQIDL